jgi:O-antigen/teichoic acid export membrane protein
MRDAPTAGQDAPHDATHSSEHLSANQIRGSSLLLAGQVVAVVLNLVAQVLLVRYLSKADYGAFAFALAVVQVAEIIAAAGLRRGVNRFLPLYEERGERAHAAGLLVFVVTTVVALGLAVVVLVVGLKGTITHSVADGPEAAAVLSILIVLTPLHALENLLDSAFAVFGRAGPIAVRRHLFIPVMRLAVVILLVAAQGGVQLIAWGWVVVGVVGIVSYGALLARVLGERGLLAPIRSFDLRFPVRDVLFFSIPLVTSDIAAAAFSAAGTAMLGFLADANEVASFRAVFPVSFAMTYVVANFELLFVPVAARLHARDDREAINRLYWLTTAWTTVLALPIFLLAFVFATPLVTLLFGERYADSGNVLAVMAVGHYFYAATGQNGHLLGIYGQVRYLAIANAIAVGALLALNVLLIPPFGALGASIALTAALLLINVLFNVALARRTNVHGFDASFGGLFTLVLGVTAVCLAFNALVHPSLLAALPVVAAGCFGVLVYARRHLAFTETFPELARVPGLSRLLLAPERRR